MNRRKFIYAGAAAGMFPGVVRADDPPSEAAKAVLFRQVKPENTRFLMVQLEREAVAQPMLRKLLGAKPKFANAQLQLMGFASEGGVRAGSASDTIVDFKNAFIAQPRDRKSFFNELQTISAAEVPFTLPSKMVHQTLKQGDNELETWGGGDEKGGICVLMAKNPLVWNWALFVAEGGEFNGYFAEKIKVVDAAKGTLQFSGTVVTFDFGGIRVVDHAEATLPAETIHCGFGYNHVILTMQKLGRAEMVAEIQKSAH